MIPERTGPPDATWLTPAPGVGAPDTPLRESIGWIRRGVWLYASALAILLGTIGAGAAIGWFSILLPFVLLEEPGVPAVIAGMGLFQGIALAVSLLGLVAWREGARSLPESAAGLGSIAVASAETARWAYRRSVICLWLVPAIVLFEVVVYASLFSAPLQHCPASGCGSSSSPNFGEALPLYVLFGGAVVLWCLIAAVFLYAARSLVAVAELVWGPLRRTTRRFAGAAIFVGGSLAPVPTVLFLFTAAPFSGGMAWSSAVPPALVLLGLTILGAQLRTAPSRFPATRAPIAVASR